MITGEEREIVDKKKIEKKGYKGKRLRKLWIMDLLLGSKWKRSRVYVEEESRKGIKY